MTDKLNLNAANTKRRFIASAVCPSCKQVDKIFVDLTNDFIACVACDFYEERPSVRETTNGVRVIEKPKPSNVQSTPDFVRLVDE